MGQMVSIVMTIVIMAFVALRFKSMPYSFWRITIRFIFYKDIKPIKWLSENPVYLYYLIFIMGKFITFMGLVHQLSSGRLSERMPEFYFSSPLNNIMLTFILMEHYKIIDTNKGFIKFLTLLNKRNKLKNH